MSLYEPKKASIDDTEGRGYAFSKRRFLAKPFRASSLLKQTKRISMRRS